MTRARQRLLAAIDVALSITDTDEAERRTVTVAELIWRLRENTMATQPGEIDMATERRSAWWTKYNRILADAGITDEERERVLSAEAQDRIRAACARRSKAMARAETVRP